MKLYQIVFFYFCFIQINIGQSSLSQEELSDFAFRAKNQIMVFLNNVPIIAAGEKSSALRESAAASTLKIFAANAFIQEQSKLSTRKTNYSPSEYLAKLKSRSERAPVLIDFEIIDDLSPDKMKMKKNADGTISYKGKMVFRQYYCKLKEHRKIKEPTEAEPNINCAYNDVTDKKVSFEIKVESSKMGQFWVTKIMSIEVLRVV